MDVQEVDNIFRQTLDDRKFSRAEKQALRQIVDEISNDENDYAVLRSRAFAIARAAMESHQDTEVIDWLEGLIKLLVTPNEITRPSAAEAFFSPGDECVDCILGLLRTARKQVDICVFTITDNRIADAILDAHRRNVRIRIVTDDRKSSDRGSDIEEFEKAGIPISLDQSDKHMHHKFAVFDRKTLVTGSYNWTRTAATQNEENLVLTDDAALVARFGQEFETLWQRYHVDTANIFDDHE